MKVYDIIDVLDRDCKVIILDDKRYEFKVACAIYSMPEFLSRSIQRIYAHEKELYIHLYPY